MLPSAFAAPTPLWLPPGPAPLVVPTSRNTDGLSTTPTILCSFSSTVAPAPTEGGEHPWHVEALLFCAAPPWLPPAEAGPVSEPPDAPPDDESPVLGPKGAFVVGRARAGSKNCLRQTACTNCPPAPPSARRRPMPRALALTSVLAGPAPATQHGRACITSRTSSSATTDRAGARCCCRRPSSSHRPRSWPPSRRTNRWTARRSTRTKLPCWAQKVRRRRRARACRCARAGHYLC